MSIRRVVEISSLALGFLLVFSLLAIPAAHAAVSIAIDKNSQTMTVAVDGVTKYTWPVSSGLPAYETPSGTYTAFRMEADHYSKEWDDAPMPHSIFFTKRGHAIHGTDAVRNIGNPASHGCVRLSREHAATLFKLVEEQGVLNTTVTLTGSSRVALARRKAPTTAVARAEPRMLGGEEIGDATVEAPRQLLPRTYRDQTTRSEEDNLVYGVDQWGRTVVMRRPQRPAYDAQSYYARPYDSRPYYAPQPGYGTRNPYYAPRRGLFTEGW